MKRYFLPFTFNFNINYIIYESLITKIHTHFPVECPPGLLKTEVVIQFLVRKIAALKRQIIPSVENTLAHGKTVTEVLLHGHTIQQQKL